MKLFKTLLLLAIATQVGASLQADTVAPVVNGTLCTSGGAKGQKMGASCYNGRGTVGGGMIGDGSVWCVCAANTMEG